MQEIFQTIESIEIKASSLVPEHDFLLPERQENDLKIYPENFQKAGEVNAWRYLHSFLADRGKNYSKHISKPMLSRKSCARISPYLAWGNLSLRQVYQTVKSHSNYSRYKFSFDGMLTRLHWRDHFIQKFEVECSYSYQCVNPAYESMVHGNDTVFLEAWKNGKTGYPLIDACMRCLKETGWINFRMRAMLVSFLCFNLDQDWRNGVYYLAQLFLDYEPGIHYPQVQMQAGVTGINTIRMYNPIKQSQDNDSEAEFIKKWIPELSNLPLVYIHEPWKTPLLEQSMFVVVIGKDYPSPIVDLESSTRYAKEKIWSYKKSDEVKKQNNRIVITHTRNKDNAANTRSNKKLR